MRKIRKIHITLIIIATLFTSVSWAQDISCKKIFPMPNDLAGMENSEVLELPNNQYLIGNKKYDQDFNLLYEYTDFFDGVVFNNINIFQNKIFVTSRDDNSGTGNLIIKLFDNATATFITSYTIGTLHSSDSSNLGRVTTAIDDSGNYYVFILEDNYFSGIGHRYYHRLYKFNNQLSLVWTKDYNPSNYSIAPFKPYKMICFNDRIILSGAIFGSTNEYFYFDNFSISPTSGDRHFLFLIDPNNGNIQDYIDTYCYDNGQLQNFYKTKVFKYQNNLYLITSEKSSSNQNFLYIRKYAHTNSSISLSVMSHIKTTSDHIATHGYLIKDDKLIVAAYAHPGTLTQWSGSISNSGLDIIWLQCSANDFSNKHLNLSNTNNVFIGNIFQKIDDKFGALYSKLGGDGIVTIDNQSLYMNDGDMAFAVFSGDSGFSDIDFYTQNITPNPTNPNNYLNQDKPIRFKLKVKNELSQALSTLTGTITCTTPGVSITDDTASFPAATSGSSVWSNDEFEITVDPTVANGTNLEFELSLNDSFVSGGPWTSYFSFPIAPLQTGNIQLVDNQGDNDGIPEPGENGIKVQPSIDNVSGATMAMVRGILSSDDSFLAITQDNFQYNVFNNVPDPIQPGDTNIVPQLPYEFSYPASAPLQELNFNLELQANLNDANGTLLKWQETFSFNDGIEPPPSLVSTNPQDDAVDVPVDTDLTMVFDKDVTPVSGKNIYLYKNSNLELTIPVTSSNVSVNADTVTIDLTADLDGGTDYYIMLDNGAFVDNNGLPFDGLNTSVAWNFTTVQSNPPNAPVITSVTAVSDSEIEVVWDAVPDADTYKIMSCDETTVYASGLTTTDHTVGSLNASTYYDFIVKAVNQAGDSPASNCEGTQTFCAQTWGSPVTYGNQLITVYGIVTIDGQPASEHDKVGAFANNELRGIGDVVPYNGTAYTTIMVENNGQEDFSFKIWDQSACSEVNTNLTVTASAGQTLGLPPNYLQIAGSTVSINDSFFDKAIQLYPNPTDDIIKINTSKDITIDKIKVYTILGTEVLTKTKDFDTISLKSLSKGVYFINIYTQKGMLVKKIIKK